MIYPEEKITMKDARTAILRTPGPEDAKEMLEYIRKMSQETIFVGRYPEEILETELFEQKFLESCQKSRKELQISAFVDGKLAGNASISPVSERIKLRHRADFGSAGLEEDWGLGLGNALTFACISRAEKMGYVQVELTTLEKNEKGMSLYQKAGFQTWGRLENCFRLKDGSFEAGRYMVKTLR